MSEDSLKALSDIVSDAHARIQASHEHINPVVEVRRGKWIKGVAHKSSPVKWASENEVSSP